MDEAMTPEVETRLKVEQVRLIKIIESFEKLNQSIEWTTLKELVFDKELNSIDKQLFVAVMESPLDLAKIYTLQGKKSQASKFEINSFVETLKKQLEGIKNKLK